MNPTKIEWCDFTANPIRFMERDGGREVWGCVKVSAGCAHCYAEALAKRYRRGGPYTVGRMAELECFFDGGEAREMLRSKRIAGKRVFVGDMTDVFGEWVPDAVLDRLFAVFALRPDVTFQVLTKRPERLRAYQTAGVREYQVALDGGHVPVGGAFWPEGSACTRIISRVAQIEAEMGLVPEYPRVPSWPLPNVWLGVSVEDQAAADARIPELLATPAAVRFLSCEPLIGPVSIEHWLSWPPGGSVQEPTIGWCIAGGESGPGARPCELAWLRSLVAQCRAAGVPAFVKQLGSRPTLGEYETLDGWPEHVKRDVWSRRGKCDVALLRDRKGGEPSEWPEDLRIREFPAVTARARTMTAQRPFMSDHEGFAERWCWRCAETFAAVRRAPSADDRAEVEIEPGKLKRRRPVTAGMKL